MYKELTALYNAGHSLRVMASRLGVSKNQVYYTLKKLSLPRRKIALQQQGEKHNRAKLTSKQVEEIRILIKSGMKLKHIADFYFVDPSTITAIKIGKSWKAAN
jgi:transposase